MPFYTIQTERFGEIRIEADNIEAARADAKQRFRVKNPKLVQAERTYKMCECCGCKPCCCK